MTKLLIGIEGSGLKQTEDLKVCVKEISSVLELLAISSVYSDSNMQALSLIGQNLKICISAKTSLDAKAVLAYLLKAEEHLNQPNNKQNFLFNLLAFEDQISVLPSLTLPYPDLHKANMWLSPAAELWPDYSHPVLDQKLADMARASLSNMQTQFIAQSKCLLDF